MTGLSINEDINSALVAVTDIARQKILTNFIQNLPKEKKELWTLKYQIQKQKM